MMETRAEMYQKVRDAREIRFQTVRSALKAAIEADREYGWVAECKLALAALAALEAEERQAECACDDKGFCPKCADSKHPPAPPAAECACSDSQYAKHHCLICGWYPIEGMQRYLGIHGEEAQCMRCNAPLPSAALAAPCECQRLREELDEAQAQREWAQTQWGKADTAAHTFAAELRQAVDALRRHRQGMVNLLYFRKLTGSRYGNLTREEIEAVMAEMDPIISAYDVKHGEKP